MRISLRQFAALVVIAFVTFSVIQHASTWAAEATNAGEAEADATRHQRLSKAIAALSPRVLSDTQREEAASMIERDLRRRRDVANERNRDEWYAIKNRTQWEAYRDVRLDRLRKSLGSLSAPPVELNTKVTGIIDGDGFRIENVVYESRPGDWVTGNLYVPLKPLKSMPGIVIAHAHHRPKRQGELQDMGMTWARAGCLVLVIDQVGYGERRAHPFNGKDDFAKDYRWSRQDYYYRYDSGVQLQLAGDSLMGWMAWDLMRGVDLLLARDGIDPQRIIILGAVAGGGDPCGVTAALDHRIAAAVPFNFGGPQPETRYPLPDDTESSFNYMMGSYWESTRGLRRTAADGFFHWVIVAGIAPRRLVHAHEFAWDGERDPVWKRYQRIYGDFYNMPDNLTFAHGKGTIRGPSAGASHCTNIGSYHRRMIHPAFKRWFGIDVKPDDEYRSRRDNKELTSLTEAARQELQPAGFVKLVRAQGQKRATQARRRLESLNAIERRVRLRSDWARLLGDVTLGAEPKVRSSVVLPLAREDKSGAKVERVVLEVEPGFIVPLLVISASVTARAPVVVGLAQGGKDGFLKHRADQLAELVDKGAIVCLPDLRGTGESKAGTSRGRTSGDGNRSVNLLLFDQTMLGQRLRDLKSVVAYLRSRKDVDGKRVSLWGDSFTLVNPADTDFKIPHGVDGRPRQPEPMGGLLSLLGGLFDDDIARVYVHGGLSGYLSVLDSPHVYIPHDVVIPGALTAGDLCDVAAALAPRPLCLANLVDGLNRRTPIEATRRTYQPTIRSYRRVNAERQLVFGDASSPAEFFLAATVAQDEQSQQCLPPRLFSDQAR